MYFSSADFSPLGFRSTAITILIEMINAKRSYNRARQDSNLRGQSPHDF